MLMDGLIDVYLLINQALILLGSCHLLDDHLRSTVLLYSCAHDGAGPFGDCGLNRVARNIIGSGRWSWGECYCGFWCGLGAASAHPFFETAYLILVGRQIAEFQSV